MADTMREAFEAWLQESGAFTDWSRDKTSEDNPYHKPLVERTWQAWQAATAAESERIAAERSGIEHFWSPPDGSRILGMVKYQDMIVVATDGGVYVIAPPGRGLTDHEVRKISHDTLRALTSGTGGDEQGGI